MPSRTYEVEAEDVLPEGWTPDGPPIDIQPDELPDFLLRMGAVLELVGGVFSIVAVREQVGADLWVPRFYRAKWESYAPSVRLPKDEPQPEPEQEKEEVEVPQEAVEEVELPAHPLDGLVSEPA